jgi:hypothetical protein
MTINKAHWVTEGDNVRFSMPFGKIDQERRIVSGFATLDNIDKQNDIVTTDASIEAFKKFRGNIREMHSPLAVGKMVNFKEDKYFDPQTKNFYKGVYVSAYISKGAQNTWEKVLDGTLTGFSIGGNIKKFDDEFNEELKKSVRIIKEYELSELSLVDNPANEFANVISIEKGELGGYLAKAEIENVFWDAENDIVLISPSETESSPKSGQPMQNIGFIEKSDINDKDRIKFLVDSAKGISTIKINKEVNLMTEDTPVVPEAEVAAETPVVENVEVAPEATAEVVAEAEAVVAEAATEPAIAKSDEVANSTPTVVEDRVDAVTEINKNVTDIKDSLTNALSNLTQTIKSVQDSIAVITKSLEEVTGKVNSVTSEVKEVKGSFDEFGKRVDAVEADTAFRKSGDLGEIVQEFSNMKTHKSLWGGRFLTNADLFN